MNIKKMQSLKDLTKQSLSKLDDTNILEIINNSEPEGNKIKGFDLIKIQNWMEMEIQACRISE